MEEYNLFVNDIFLVLPVERRSDRPQGMSWALAKSSPHSGDTRWRHNRVFQELAAIINTAKKEITFHLNSESRYFEQDGGARKNVVKNYPRAIFRFREYQLS